MTATQALFELFAKYHRQCPVSEDSPRSRELWLNDEHMARALVRQLEKELELKHDANEWLDALRDIREVIEDCDLP